MASRTRAGPALVTVLCAAGVVAFIGVETTPADQRDDWRGVAKAIGPATLGARAVVVDPSDGAPALALYLPLQRAPMPPGSYPSLTVREIDVIDVARNPPLPAPSAGVAGFTRQAVVHTGAYTLVRYVAAAPMSESYAQIDALALVPGSGANGGPTLLTGSAATGP